MGQIYLRYMQNHDDGIDPWEVSISADTEPLSLTKKNLRFVSARTIVTDLTPRKLIDLIADEVIENGIIASYVNYPSAMPDDDSIHSRIPPTTLRSVTYYGKIGSLTRIENSMEENEAEALEYNRALHNKIYPVFEKFIEEQSRVRQAGE